MMENFEKKGLGCIMNKKLKVSKCEKMKEGLGDRISKVNVKDVGNVSEALEGGGCGRWVNTHSLTSN